MNPSEQSRVAPPCLRVWGSRPDGGGRRWRCPAGLGINAPVNCRASALVLTADVEVRQCRPGKICSILRCRCSASSCRPCAGAQVLP